MTDPCAIDACVHTDDSVALFFTAPNSEHRCDVCEGTTIAAVFAAGGEVAICVACRGDWV